MAADAVDHLMALMDALDAPGEDIEADSDDDREHDGSEDDGTAEAEPDDEDGHDREPSLGAPENHPGRYHRDMEGREHFARRGRPFGDQTTWASGGSDDSEDTFADLEPEPGYDLPCDDDERDGDGSSYGEVTEYTLGWNQTVSQLALGIGTDDRETTALERFGKGLLRSGPDDSEDSDPVEDDGTAEPEEGAWESRVPHDQSRWCAAVTPPRLYAMWCKGDCCDPVIPDGSRVIVDSEAPFGPGDFVVVHYDDPRAEGGIASKVKQLAHGLPPSLCLPIINDAEFTHIMSARMLNPPRPVYYDTAMVHAVHKVVRVERPRA